MHGCDASIGLRDHRPLGLGRWLVLLLTTAGIVVVSWVGIRWSLSSEGALAVSVRLGVMACVFVMLVLALWLTVNRASRPPGGGGQSQPDLSRQSWRYAADLCPHGIALFAGRGPLLPWSHVSAIQVYLTGPGRGGAVAARLRSFAEPTGLPAVARMVNDRSVPDDPSLIWLGNVRNAAEADRVRTQTSRWRDLTAR
ncbi:hypothetical protein E1211_08100 [Micromonospora sp. 15K316]|uniref:hypothetical protein n=1 Tax=Micromonospora sp. 15K316 TaxID=2530376 RepID=UPI00104C0905|nr:hypothetical protein [Micromonospora sp. 15K316]TDC38146.1 hypothetical protein E1211_08100 [Micromonospora sp. 15K316]